MWVLSILWHLLPWGSKLMSRPNPNLDSYILPTNLPSPSCCHQAHSSSKWLWHSIDPVLNYCVELLCTPIQLTCLSSGFLSFPGGWIRLLNPVDKEVCKALGIKKLYTFKTSFVNKLNLNLNFPPYYVLSPLLYIFWIALINFSVTATFPVLQPKKCILSLSVKVSFHSPSFLL